LGLFLEMGILFRFESETKFQSILELNIDSHIKMFKGKTLRFPMKPHNHLFFHPKCFDCQNAQFFFCDTND